MNYSHRYAKRAENLTPSPIRKLVPLMREPGMISFGGGYPNASTFAFESLSIKFRSGENYVLDGALIDEACQYGPTDCNPRLRNQLKLWHQSKDDWCPDDDQLQILNGSQEGLHIMGYLFLEPGDCVAVSEPAYPGAIGAFRAFTNSFISYPIDENGSRIDILEAKLRTLAESGKPLPKFIYEVPNGHNPGGVTLSLERRKKLIELAEEFDCLILEDDPYQLVQLDDSDPLPTLQSIDRRGQVIRLDSFSKIFAPGLRIGYATGPSEVIDKFQVYKQGTNLHVSSLVQLSLYGYLEKHGPKTFRKLIRDNCQLYRANRDCMVKAMTQSLPGRVRFNIPTSGMFIWLELPEEYDCSSMIEQYSLKNKVLLVPGTAFSTSNKLKNCMRLSFSMVTEGQVREGIHRLADMIETYRVS